ncbi:hypothetical protein HMPREF9124_0359 [Oribacterium sp. oral taxon 108 str. F0425]|nr:hypothetical protein HMPREF9124_0359 [Oribacterium sp. oral taxon 108 str. F0425]
MDLRYYRKSGCFITRNKPSTLSERCILSGRVKAVKAGV